MNGTGWGGKAQEEDKVGIEEYSAVGAPARREPHEPHASAHGAYGRGRSWRGEARFSDFLRGRQGHSQEDIDREYSEPVQVAFDAGVECAEEQEEGVTTRRHFAGFGRSDFWGAFFLLTC